jgi:hypothetical protein
LALLCALSSPSLPALREIRGKKPPTSFLPATWLRSWLIILPTIILPELRDCSIITESFALAVVRFQAKNEEPWQNNRGQNDSDLDPILAYDFAHNHFA